MSWRQTDNNVWEFSGSNLPDPKAYSFFPIALPEHRNARIRFSVTFNGGPTHFHAALCFRRIDEQRCYGVGLGGWAGQFSYFQRSELGFQRSFFGDERAIQPNRDYEFEIQYRGNRIEHFRLLGTHTIQLISTSVLPNAYMRGGLALYGYGGPTQAKLKILDYEDLGLRAFMICRIDGGQKKKYLQIRRILKRHGVALELFHGETIETYPGLMRSILGKMLECDFSISWFTKALRPNVAYETGIAHALNIPTIHIIDNIKKLPSDLGSQFFVTEKDLSKKLPMDVAAILKKEINDVRYLL